MVKNLRTAILVLSLLFLTLLAAPVEAQPNSSECRTVVSGKVDPTLEKHVRQAHNSGLYAECMVWAKTGVEVQVVDLVFDQL